LKNHQAARPIKIATIAIPNFAQEQHPPEQFPQQPLHDGGVFCCMENKAIGTNVVISVNRDFFICILS
jgi:hypothetical protein